MPIALNCPGCKTSYKIPDKFIGKDIQCKKCPQTISVVDEAEEEAAAEEAKRIARIRKRKKNRQRDRKVYFVASWCFGIAAILGLAIKIFNTYRIFDLENRIEQQNQQALGNGQVGQRGLLDADTRLRARFNSADERYVIDSPQRRINQIFFNYRVVDSGGSANQMDKRSGIPSTHFAFGSLSIAVALPNNAQIMETRVMNPNLANSGTLGFMTMIGQMPSGSRICLVMDGKRVSNILSVD